MFKLLTVRIKLKAFFIHFLISLTILIVLFSILFKLWFPSPFFIASGGIQGLKLVALVDLVLGPLLTLIVYDSIKSKKALLLDFSFIAAFQVSALIWGVTNIYNQRPIAIVFWENTFYTVPAIAFDSQNFNTNVYGDKTPVYIYAKKPRSINDINKMVERLKKYNRPPHHQIELYHSLNPFFSDIIRFSLNIDEIINHNKQMKQKLEIILKQTNTQKNDNYYIPLESRYQNIIMVYDRNEKLIGSINAPYK
jgi:hypothetical protein